MSFRIRCFLSHLFLSCMVGCLTAATVYGIWYPGALAKAVGVSHIFLLLLCIDVTVGPLLTLFLAKKGKKGLWLDLVTVVILQITPRIKCDYTHAQTLFAKNPLGKPGWAMVRPARDKKETSDWIWLELEKGKSPALRAELYQPIDGHWDEFSREIQPLNKLGNYNIKKEVETVLAKYPEADGFLPMMGGEWDMTVLVSRKAQKILGVVDLRPW